MSEYLELKADKFVFRAKNGLRYSRDEVWVSTEGKLVRVGITDFAQRRGGDIVFADITPAGTEVTSGGLLGSYETVKMVRDILSPLGGVIREVNPALESRPEVINSDPYGEGWIAVIEPATKPEGLLSADEYFEQMKAKVAEELRKIKGM
ncbi:TPA: glycine cleavage system protein GcvH [Candidatus Bathyarchaeota archaeon]|nr:glycine cleavage system protein GcvH [Candidatus Bathyarchaeota archaeon]